jgi:four helix bundle protein
MKYERFEDLPVWQEAARLYNLTLDLLETHGRLFSRGYRDQLDRAALSVSNNIAEGYERMTTGGLLMFIDIARGSGGEVKSMMSVLHLRPSIAPARSLMQGVRASADSCVRQLTGWINSIESGPIQGKRHLTGPQKREREAAQKVADFRLRVLRSYKPGHPLYNTPEARRARGESVE